MYQMSKSDDYSLRTIGCLWHRDISDRETMDDIGVLSIINHAHSEVVLR